MGFRERRRTMSRVDHDRRSMDCRSVQPNDGLVRGISIDERGDLHVNTIDLTLGNVMFVLINGGRSVDRWYSSAMILKIR